MPVSMLSNNQLKPSQNLAQLIMTTATQIRATNIMEMQNMVS
jgi:hypothetical protein